MNTWYRTSRLRNDIEAVQVTRSTEKSVWINEWGRECRHDRISRYEQYHETPKEAIEFKRSQLESSVSAAKSRLREAEASLCKFERRATEGTIVRETQE